MYYLRIIQSLNDSWCSLISDDPVRPGISIDDRLHRFGEILVSVDEQDEPLAAICIKYCSTIPATVDDLLADPGQNLMAIFYSIWSYRPGHGGPLVFAARNHILNTRPTVERFITMSPQTAMARNFHLKNGAVVLRENHSTVNYEYR